jgi:glycosyltransferase involved in cell wall biosynthesis
VVAPTGIDIVRLVVATPYPEGSTLAIARAAADDGSLLALYTSGHTWVISRRLPDHVSGAFGLGQYLRRRELPGIPPGLVKDRADGPELARAVIAHIPGLQGLANRTMYAAKTAFDRAVARELPPADAVLGIYGSAALTLRAANAMGVLTVLNFVNSHPAEHNRFLRELAGLRGPSHELVPERVAQRVEQELSLADLVLVPSRFVANQLLERGLPESRLVVIPYGVDLGAFSPDTDRPPNARVRCVYVGQISHRKGIPVLLRAARGLPDIDFVLTGPVVTPSLLRELPPNARWMGPLPHADVAALMRESDIFVLPSLEDSYGLVVSEAMASGLPVVVTDHVGASEIVEPGLTGFVVPAGDHTPLGAALRCLADDSDLRSRMGAASRSRMASGQSWAQYGTEVLSVVDRALKKESPG